MSFVHTLSAVSLLAGGLLQAQTPMPYFGDVPVNSHVYEATSKMHQLGVTAVCNTKPLLFCPDGNVKRREMATFIVRAWSVRLWGSPEAFRTKTSHLATPVFPADVLTSDEDFIYIQKLGQLGIAIGCAPRNFCPQDYVTTYEAAVLATRAKAAADAKCLSDCVSDRSGIEFSGASMQYIFSSARADPGGGHFNGFEREGQLNAIPTTPSVEECDKATLDLAVSRPCLERTITRAQMAASIYSAVISTAPSFSSSFMGALTSQADCSTVRGWLWDRQPNEITFVDIFDGSRLIYENWPANQFDPSVLAITSQNGSGDNGYHAFVYQLSFDPTLIELQHTIIVRPHGTTFSLPGSPTVQFSCGYNGALDMLTSSSIVGWAKRIADPTHPTLVDLVFDVDVNGLDQNNVITVVANGARGNMPETNDGFSIPTPSGIKDGNDHYVSAYYNGTSVELPNSPMFFSTAQNREPLYIGSLDPVTESTISGWAIDENHGVDHIEVALYDSNRLIASASANQPRSDLDALQMGAHGFAFTPPSSLLDGRAHSLSVRFERSAIDLTHSPQAFFVLPGAAAPPIDVYSVADFRSCVLDDNTSSSRACRVHAGTYSIDSTIVITKSNLRIDRYLSDKVTLRRANAQVYRMLSIEGGASNIWISGLIFDGNKQLLMDPNPRAPVPLTGGGFAYHDYECNDDYNSNPTSLNAQRSCWPAPGWAWKRTAPGGDAYAADLFIGNGLPSAFITIIDNVFINSSTTALFFKGPYVSITKNTFGALPDSNFLNPNWSDRTLGGINSACGGHGRGSYGFYFGDNTVAHYYGSAFGAPNAGSVAWNNLYHNTYGVQWDGGGGQIYLGSSSHVDVHDNRINGGWSDYPQDHGTTDEAPAYHSGSMSDGFETNRAVFTRTWNNLVSNNALFGYFVGQGTQYFFSDGDHLNDNGYGAVSMGDQRRNAISSQNTPVNALRRDTVSFNGLDGINNNRNTTSVLAAQYTKPVGFEFTTVNATASGEPTVCISASLNASQQGGQNLCQKDASYHCIPSPLVPAYELLPHCVLSF